jgi:eukaryotic-like serine/threonine-protein kinase
MSAPDDENEPSWKPKGPSLDSSGRLRGNTGLGPGQKPGTFTVPRPRIHQDEPLELADREPKSSEDQDLYRPYLDEPKRPFRIPRWPIALVVLGLIGAAAWFFRPDIKFGVKLNPVTSAPALLHIDSEPSGAKVKVNGTVIGDTPVILDNLYAGEATVEISRRGYKTWRGTFQGGEKVKIEAQLRK